MTDRRPAPVLLVGATLVALAAVASPSGSAQKSSPELGRTFVVSQVSGTVLVKPAGSARFSRLTGRRTIPVGSTVNATDGKVRLAGAKSGGGTQSGVFYGGAFRATQAEADGAFIDLQLVGGRFGGCASTSGASSSARRRLGRKLWGNARGNFRTRGRHSSATVRGTKWLTRDRCASTGIAARQGTVESTDVASDQAVQIKSGQSLETFCFPSPEFDQRDYCLQIYNLFFGHDVALLTIDSRVHQGEYTICVRSPSGARSCETYPLSPSPHGSEHGVTGAVQCYPKRRKGTWTATWTVQGEVLGTLPFEVTRPYDSHPRGCPTMEGIHIPTPVPSS